MLVDRRHKVWGLKGGVWKSEDAVVLRGGGEVSFGGDLLAVIDWQEISKSG